MWSKVPVKWRSRRAAALGLAALVVIALGVGGIDGAGLLSWAKDNPPIGLQMHRAVYDLSIDHLKSASDAESLDGRMVVEWRGGPGCDGYTSEQRVVTRSSDAAGGLSISDVRLSSFESLDGNDFRFDRLEYTDGKLTEHASGRVTRKNGKAVLTEPDEAPRELRAGVLFPTAFNIALMNAARAGKTSFSGELFDGTQSTPTYVNAFIGKPGTPPADSMKVSIESRGEGEELKSASPWHVHMSYFDDSSGGGDESADGTPDFEMGFAMFPNGVMGGLTLDYDDVVLGGHLSQIKYFKSGSC